MSTIYSLESDIKAAKERLSLIAKAFAVVEDPTVDGNRAANARQTIRDVLAGVEVSVVTKAEHLAAIEKERALWQETVAKLTADNAALRAAAAPLIDAVCSGASDDGETAPAFLIDAANRCQQALASPNPGAGWVSPEDHARALREQPCCGSATCDRVKAAEADFAWCNEQLTVSRARLVEVEAERDAYQAYQNIASMNEESALAAIAERDAARARLAEVEADLATSRLFGAEAVQRIGQQHRELIEQEADLARVKAEAEGLRARLDYVRAAALHCLKTSGEERDDAVRDLDLAFSDAASPTPAIEPVDTEAK